MNINYVCLNCYACIIFFGKIDYYYIYYYILYMYNICVQMQVCYIELYYTDMLPICACVRACVCVCTFAHAYMLAWVHLCQRAWDGGDLVVGWLSVSFGGCVWMCVGLCVGVFV